MSVPSWNIARYFSRLHTITGYDSLYYASGRVKFLLDLLIGIIIGYLVYTLEWSYVRESIIIFLVWFLGLFNYLAGTSAFQTSNLLVSVTIDLTVIVIAAYATSYGSDYRSKLIAIILLALIVLPLSYLLMVRYGIIINSFLIVGCILIATSFSQYTDRKIIREKSRLAHARSTAEFAVVSHISHSVRPHILMARAPLLALKTTLSTRNLLNEPLPGVQLNGASETIGEALEKALVSLRQINDVVANARQLIGREIHPEEFAEAEIFQVFEQDILPLYRNQNFMVQITGDRGLQVRLHRASFVEAMHNLIRNAQVHGFAESDDQSEHRYIRFHLQGNVRFLFIDYSNNGTPFPPNLDEAAFLAFGKKSSSSPGEGLGGAWIGKVVEAHGGTFEIIRDDVPVHFRITLPRKASYG